MKFIKSHKIKVGIWIKHKETGVVCKIIKSSIIPYEQFWEVDRNIDIFNFIRHEEILSNWDIYNPPKLKKILWT